MLFILAVQLFLLSFMSIFILIVLSGIETISVRNFASATFESGIIVHTQELELTKPFNFPESDVTIKKSEGIFKFASDEQVYFASKTFLFEPSRVNTSIQLNGVGICEDGKLTVTIRLSIVSFLYVLALTTLLITGIYIVYDFTGNIQYLIIGLAGFVFVEFLFVYDFLLEKRRMGIMIDELSKMLSSNKIIKSLNHR